MQNVLRNLVAVLFLLNALPSFAYDLVVAKDGTGDFKTIREAIQAAPTGLASPFRIFIKNGTYREKDTIPSNKPFIQLIGESVAKTIISWDDFSGKPIPGGGNYGTSNSATLVINANDFSMVNITVENTTGDAPQALAINVNADRASFLNCRFLGGQDTVLTNGDGKKNFFKNCYIDGVVDFIFGGNRAVFDSCIIYAKTRKDNLSGSYITAANTTKAEPYGMVFRDCYLPANQGVTRYVLGRPWQNATGSTDKYNKTVFLNSTYGANIVQPAGWSTWDAGTITSQITYAEYKSKNTDNSAADISGRVAWSKQLSDAEAAVYNNTNLFAGWDPCSVFTQSCNGPRDIAVSNFQLKRVAANTQLTWNISWPMSGIKYELFRSTDNIAFSPVNEQTAVNDTSINFSYQDGIPAPGTSFYYYLVASKGGLASHVSDTILISSVPAITVTGTPGAFLQGLGTPSNVQVYTVSGTNLTNNIVITAPAGFEISPNGGTNWYNSATPITLTPVAGNVGTTNISVRLNALAAGPYAGSISHTSTGAAQVDLALTGTVQAAPLAVSETLIHWPFNTGNQDSAALRSLALDGSLPTFGVLKSSDGVTVAGITPYSVKYGRAFAPNINGAWGVANGGNGGNLSRIIYDEYTVVTKSTHQVRVDSMVISAAFYNTSSNTKLAVIYSRSGFITDSADVTGGIGPSGALAGTANGQFATPVLLANQTGGPTNTYSFALNGSTGVQLLPGETLTVRFYYSCGSTSTGRYAMVKNVVAKGVAEVAPVNGDFKSVQNGDWTDLNTWARFDGNVWVTPAPEYPVYNNATNTRIQSGHAVTISAKLPNGSGYIDRTHVMPGAQLIVGAGADLNVANDGSPSTATTDLLVDGTMTVLGRIFTNGNVSVVVNGNFIYSGTGMNLGNAGDSVYVGEMGTYQHNANSSTTPANFSFHPNGTFKITGLTTSQTGIFKTTARYGNIIWENAGQLSYYAIRRNLDSNNVKGSFTVKSTGTTYLSMVNNSGRMRFPGGYYQTGGTVNYRESGTVVDTLDIGGDFSVTGGIFNTNAGGANSLLIRLLGTNKTLAYPQSGATNNNWLVTGVYTLGSGLVLPNAGYGMTVAGTLHGGTNNLSGPGDFAMLENAILSSAHENGLDGTLLNAGTKSLGTGGQFIFNGLTPQATGALLPASIKSLTINNAAGVALGSHVVVNGAPLTLTAGQLLLGNNDITVSTISGANTTRYIVTNGSGLLTLINVGAGINAFPVGYSQTSFNPVVISNAGVADNFSVNVKNVFDHPFPVPAKAVNIQWNISEEVPGGSLASLGFSWVEADEAADFTTASPVAVFHYEGGGWNGTPAVITGTGIPGNPFVASATGFTSFSPFAVANSDAALPLKLVSFDAFPKQSGVATNWKVAYEIAISHYEVERSEDGVAYTSLGRVEAMNSPRPVDYAFTDAKPLSGNSFYRLKVAELDGKIIYSRSVKVNVATIAGVHLYPNPAKNAFSLQLPAGVKTGNYSVVEASGRILQAGKISTGARLQSINVTGLPTGVYWFVIDLDGKKQALRFIKE